MIRWLDREAGLTGATGLEIFALVLAVALAASTMASWALIAARLL